MYTIRKHISKFIDYENDSLIQQHSTIDLWEETFNDNSDTIDIMVV